MLKAAQHGVQRTLNLVSQPPSTNIITGPGVRDACAHARTGRRHASLTSAISRGIRQGQGRVDRMGGSWRPPRDRAENDRSDGDGRTRSRARTEREREPARRSGFGGTSTRGGPSSRAGMSRDGDRRNSGRDRDRGGRDRDRDRDQDRRVRSRDNTTSFEDGRGSGNRSFPPRERREDRFPRREEGISTREDAMPASEDRFPAREERFPPREDRTNRGYPSTSDRTMTDTSTNPRKPPSRLDLELSHRGRSRSAVRAERQRVSREAVSTEAPHTTPYTTAGSEFLYGTFAVQAALTAGRRKFYRFYIWAGADDGEGEERNNNRSSSSRNGGNKTTPTDDQHVQSMVQLARKRGVTVQKVAGGDWERVLSKMSKDRPHNGFVLEASKLPVLPVTSLGRMSTPAATEVKMQAGTQSQEDEEVNQIFKIAAAEDNSNNNERCLARSGTRDRDRYPLLLWLDRVTDTGNLGAIMRSAVFLGVEAILIPEHGTAPFSPITVKASAGAAEHIPILVVKNESQFVKACQANGWKFFAAVSPNSSSTRRKRSDGGGSVEEEALDRAPSVLMLGNEGEGLRTFLQVMADASVSISGNRGAAAGIDSLNVSVAAALLATRFLNREQQPLAARRTTTEEVEVEHPTDDQSAVSAPSSDSNSVF